MISLKQLFQSNSEKLQFIYPKQEAESLILWLLEDTLGINRQDLLLDKTIHEVPDILYSHIKSLLEKKPIQYILGIAPFYGRSFEVNENVLIPRNETEELVHLIIQENKQLNLRILDIGTGSGCIPISLKLEIPSSKLFAIDVSPEALLIAKRNAEALEASVEFLKVDILNEEIHLNNLDIIVSNPPYVLDSEKSIMHENVLNHEPHLALFVDDDDPLIFYRNIAQKATSSLKKGGKLYFEINEAYGEDVVNLLEEMGYTEVILRRDLNDKNRMVSAALT
ncbi:peptide chain release factor N(5)-glutamine methyltransferase [Belliella kenyensis]|uniref:Release factor glutamine methyltransferase n=1 Tax=Belliella kenyensis TaxID=1472724 RepID=A0ABV8EQG7_9BACT|nr:peptide chain release factor N(5)-glutamine methyltransferase [Belliella kenyensis]MCH7401470.1 peptide chain release factor N(5)-glutamine methyltransferase [Belliella kenyensis]MDN3603249.1 peptide chain release factor N(5)-glutamine methyltransferase [Belliella kenyensis]